MMAYPLRRKRTRSFGSEPEETILVQVKPSS